MWAGIQACPPRAAASGAGQSTTVRSCDWRNSAQAPLRLKGPGMWQGPSLCAWEGVFRIARAGGVCIRKGFESASKQAHSKRFANSKAPWEVAAACRRFVSGAELDPGHPTTELDGRLPRRLAVLDLRFGGRRFPSPTGLWRNEQYVLLGLPLAHKDGVCALFGQGQGPFVRRLLKTSSARGAIALPQAPHKARMRSRRRTSSPSPSGLSAPPCSVITQSR